jgi:hypothetical protein
MKIKIDWLQVKNPDWKLASITQIDGTKLTEVSINRTTKKGEAFPNFDGLMAGHEIEVELWQSTAGKWYAFPPKDPAKIAQGGAYKQKMINDTMDKKAASIGQFQDNKELSIKVASTIKMAVDLTVARVAHEPNLDLEATILAWRKWLWQNWDVDEKQFPPF